MTDWSKFDKINAKALAEEAENLGDDDFSLIPLGKYEVRITDMQLKPTKKKGDPMLSVTFKVIAGQYKKRLDWYNQVIMMGDENDKYRLHSANTFLRSLKSHHEVKFDSVQGYSDLIDAIFDDTKKQEYELEISEKNGYRQYKIKQVFAADE